MKNESVRGVRVIVTGEINAEEAQPTVREEIVHIARVAAEALVEHAAVDVFDVVVELDESRFEIWDANGRAGFDPETQRTLTLRRHEAGEVGIEDNEGVEPPEDAPAEPREDSGEIPDYDTANSVELGRIEAEAAALDATDEVIRKKPGEQG